MSYTYNIVITVCPSLCLHKTKNNASIIQEYNTLFLLYTERNFLTIDAPFLGKSGNFIIGYAICQNI